MGWETGWRGEVLRELCNTHEEVRGIQLYSSDECSCLTSSRFRTALRSGISHCVLACYQSSISFIFTFTIHPVGFSHHLSARSASALSVQIERFVAYDDPVRTTQKSLSNMMCWTAYWTA